MNYLGFGLGLRKEHFQQIIDEKPKEVDWFEVISENYLQLDSSNCQQIEKIRADYPFVMHGVSLSIGSTDALNLDYLKKLKALEQWLQPELVSDHICWTGIQHKNTHDLLPVPYTVESLNNMVDKVKQVQDFLGRQIALENPSTYLEFQASQIPEWEFINELMERADCNLLLDINNLYVNCYNHGYDTHNYIDALPAKRVVQIHMAGHENHGTHIIDTHNHPIIPEVLDLYQYTIQKIGVRNSMIEWDSDIPALPVLLNELDKLKQTVSKTIIDAESKPSSNFPIESRAEKSNSSKKLPSLYRSMQDAIHTPFSEMNLDWIKTNQSLSSENRIGIYINAYRKRLSEALTDCFPITNKVLGNQEFNQLLTDVINENQPSHYDINQYIKQFPIYSKKWVEENTYELMMLEATIIEVGILSEQVGTPLADFQQLSPEDMFSSKVSLTKSVRLLTFKHDVYSIYQQASTNNDVENSFINSSSSIIIRKEGKRVSNISVPQESIIFLGTLQKHENLVNSLEDLLENHQIPVETSIALLGEYINEGIIWMGATQ
jgi:uncharacterized protein (UPF0276 family)